MTLGVIRGERRLTVRVPVAERAYDTGRLMELVSPQNTIRELGVLGLDLTPKIAQLLPELRREKGVVVAIVSADTPYSQQGKLEPGDVIYTVNGKVVESVEALKALMGALPANAPAVLHVERDDRLMYISFRVER